MILGSKFVSEIRFLAIYFQFKIKFDRKIYNFRC